MSDVYRISYLCYQWLWNWGKCIRLPNNFSEWIKYFLISLSLDPNFHQKKRPSLWNTFPKNQMSVCLVTLKQRPVAPDCLPCIYIYINIHIRTYMCKGNEILLPSCEIDVQNTPFNKDPGTWPNHFDFFSSWLFFGFYQHVNHRKIQPPFGKICFFPTTNQKKTNLTSSSCWFQPTHLKNMLVKLNPFPK